MGYEPSPVAWASAHLRPRHDPAAELRFVGRGRELSAIGRVLQGDDPARVLYLYGAGGIGKSALLVRVVALSGELAVPVTSIDARTIDHASAFIAQLAASEIGWPPRNPARSTRHLLIVDACESAALDAWLREVLVPRLAPSTIVLLASRAVPVTPWRALPGWRALPLDALSDAEARELLTHHHVPPRCHDAAVQLCHHHPLALVLLAALLAREPQRDLGVMPLELARDLCSLLTSELPSARHREVLEVAAVARTIDEPLLEAMLGGSDAHALFAWFAAQSWVDHSPRGVHLKGPFRDALDLELRWRNRGRRNDIAARVSVHYSALFVHASLDEQAWLSVERAYLHRHTPFFGHPQWHAIDGPDAATHELHLEVATTQDHAAIAAIVQRHEGAPSAAQCRRWLASPACLATVIRDAAGAVCYLTVAIRLDHADPEARAADPATRAAWDLITRHGGVRPGEAAVYVRYWMSRADYQAHSPTRSLMIFWALGVFSATPGLRWLVVTNTLPSEQWVSATRALGIECAPEVSFTLGDHFTHATLLDLRRVVPLTTVERVLAGGTLGVQHALEVPLASEPLVQLTRAAFDEALQLALKHFADPTRLATNALVHARLVWRHYDRLSSNDRVAILQRLVREGIAALADRPATAHAASVLAATWIEPNDGQKVVADRLGLPFGTYRHHLRSGLAALCEHLWQLEMG